MVRRICLALALGVTAIAASADFDPSMGRGFQPEKLYQFGDVDSVDLHTGALSAAIPIGPRYSTSERFSYGLTLTHSSRTWSYDVEGTGYAALPNPRANAGASWSVHLGLLIAPNDPTNDGGFGPWTYISEDGGAHFWHSTLHENESDGDPDGSWDFTRDNSYIRRHRVDADTYELEFSDGTIKKFEHLPGRPSWEFRLTEIRDSFGTPPQQQNWVRIAYDDDATPSWTITDIRGRSHFIQFVNLTYDTAAKAMVDYVDLEAQDGSPGRWDFAYSVETVYRDCRDEAGSTTTELTLPKLASVTPRDNGVNQDAWSFEYFDEAPPSSCKQTVLSRLEFPTGGRIEYDYATVAIPANDPCQPADLGATGVLAVKSRTFVDPIVTNPTQPNAEWLYDYVLTDSPETSDFCPDPEFQVWPPREQIVTVTTPLGDKSQHFFSAWPGRLPSPDPQPFDRVEFGLPITKFQSSGGRFLSSRTFDCTPSSDCYPCDDAEPETNLCTAELDRSEFALYDHDPLPVVGTNESLTRSNRRLVAKRTVFHDDGGTFADTALSSFDGVGNLRQEVLSGTFATGNSRTTITNYNDARGTFPSSYNVLMVSESWVLGTYDRIDVTAAGDTSRRLFDFDEDTGFLNSVRTVKQGTTNGTSDLFTLYCATAHGNVASELYYGGDRSPLPGTLPDCDPSPPGSGWGYRIDHGYSAGTRNSSQYAGTSHKVLDLDIDPDTGLPESSRDSAGVATDFVYDDLGRLERIRPAAFGDLDADAQTLYTYSPPSSARPRIEIDRCPASEGSCTMTNRLTHEYVEFTGFGRPWHEVRDMPHVANHATRVTRYNAMGWKDRVTSWTFNAGGNENSLPATVYAGYDAFGRPATVTLPDGKVTTFGYLGAQWVKTEQNLALTIGAADQCVRRWDRHDRQGRLDRIEEAYTACTPSATPTNTTEYAYDEAGRLTRACLNGTLASCTQQRLFTYDNRGFLTSEVHPEKGASGHGTVTYSCYDSRGHARYRDDGAASGRRLGFHHDAAERLLHVRIPTEASCTTPTPAGTNWKVFTYATANTGDQANKGKLATALRRNVLGAPYPANTVANVTETYTYEGRQGRASRRTTQLNLAGANAELWDTSQSFDDLGNLATLGYPVCTGGSCVGGGTPARSIALGYDSGLLESITGSDSTAWLTDMGYHASGMVASVTHGGGTIETIAAASHLMARPDSITVSATNEPTPWTTGVYAYDGGGNIKTLTNTLPEPDHVDRFRYDKFSRLLQAQLVQNLDAGPQTQSYGFDPYGNLTSITTTSTENFPVQGTTNRLSNTVASYDAGGNLLTWNANAYAWDLFNTMKSYTTPQESWSYVYTADDERLWSIRSDNGSQFWTVRGMGNELLTRDERLGTPGFAPLSVCPNPPPSSHVFCDNFETGDTSAWSSAQEGVLRKITDYIWRGDKLLAARQLGVPGDRHFGLDHLGTVRVVVGLTGEFDAEHTYFPFGREATSPGQNSEVMKFTGHERDLQSTPTAIADDLDMMHARFFGPVPARFLSFDPLGGAARRPQSWNRYSYVLGNPLMYTDPLGLRGCAATSDEEVSCGDEIDVTAPDPGSQGSTPSSALHYAVAKSEFAAFRAASEARAETRGAAYALSYLAQNPSMPAAQALARNELAATFLDISDELAQAIEPGVILFSVSAPARTSLASAVPSTASRATTITRSLIGKDGLLNSNRYLRFGFGRRGGEKVLRIGGSIVRKVTGKEHIDLWTIGRL